MKIFKDEATGYLIIDDLSEGVDILPSELYQSYLKQIKDLTEQNRDLQSRLNDMGVKLADALSAQAEASKQREKNETRMLDIIQATAESERAVGIAIGILCSKTGHNYRLAKLYWHEFEQWYEEACNNGTIDAIDEAYKLELATEDAKYRIGQNE